MATQTLKKWCQNPLVDDVTEMEQIRELVSEEFYSGWVRQQTVSTQQINQLFNLLTQYAPPNPACVFFQDSNITINEVTLVADGRAFTQEQAPELFEIYNGTMPNFTAEAPAGTIPVMRMR
ncbi:hypothetical protein KUA24_38 [Vibrio phage HNL01]|nr:hypothetical protein KUA24_38 [Vibrio phage HNL01]